MVDDSVGDFTTRELLGGAFAVTAGELALVEEGTTDPARLVDGRVDGRVVVVVVRLVGSPEAGRCGPAIVDYRMRVTNPVPVKCSECQCCAISN